MVEYSDEELDQAADEIQALPDSSVVVGMVSDFGGLRDELRAVGC